MTAEEYIKDFTRGYSNELENGEFEYWLTPWQAEAACNIARKETIEKACKCLNELMITPSMGEYEKNMVNVIIFLFRKKMEKQ